MARCKAVQSPQPPKPSRTVNTIKCPKGSKVTKVAKVAKVAKVSKVTKVSKVSKASKASKVSKAGQGCKSVKAQGRRKSPPPRREYARQTFPLSNVRGCPQTDAATIVQAPQSYPPEPLQGSEQKRRLTLTYNSKSPAPFRDHLLDLPNNGHRYIDARGRVIFDRRYANDPQPAKGTSKKGAARPKKKQA